jgi:hypothetical protein
MKSKKIYGKGASQSRSLKNTKNTKTKSKSKNKTKSKTKSKQNITIKSFVPMVFENTFQRSHKFTKKVNQYEKDLDEMEKTLKKMKTSIPKEMEDSPLFLGIRDEIIEYNNKTNALLAKIEHTKKRMNITDLDKLISYGVYDSSTDLEHALSSEYDTTMKEINDEKKQLMQQNIKIERQLEKIRREIKEDRVLLLHYNMKREQKIKHEKEKESKKQTRELAASKIQKISRTFLKKKRNMFLDSVDDISQIQQKKENLCKQIQSVFPSFSTSHKNIKYENGFCMIFAIIAFLSKKVEEDTDFVILLKGGKNIQIESHPNTFESDDFDILIVPKQQNENAEAKMEKIAEDMAKIIVSVVSGFDMKKVPSPSNIMKVSYVGDNEKNIPMIDIGFGFYSIPDELHVFYNVSKFKTTDTISGVINYQPLSTLINERFYYIHEYSKLKNLKSTAHKTNRPFLAKSENQLHQIMENIYNEKKLHVKKHQRERDTLDSIVKLYVEIYKEFAKKHKLPYDIVSDKHVIEHVVNPTSMIQTVMYP